MIRRLRLVVTVSASALAGFALLAPAAPLTPGNLVATVNEFTGSSTAPTYVAEYTTGGTRAQVLAQVPQPGGTGVNSDEARDVIVGPGGNVNVYNGTFTPYLARLDLATLNWNQQTFAGWSTVNNLSYGGLAQSGQYVYATDMTTFGPGETPKGVVRFDTTGGPTVRFAENTEPIDLYVSGGVVYTLTGNTVDKFDALTFAPLGSVPIPSDDNRAIGVAADGSIFVATWGGVIKHLTSAGAQFDSLTIPGGDNFCDIDVSSTGQLALATGFAGRIVITDLTLDTFTQFRATDSTLGGEVFVSWVPIPEPQAVAILFGLLGLVRRFPTRRSTWANRS